MANAQTLQVLVRIVYDDGVVAALAHPPDALQPDLFIPADPADVTTAAGRLLSSQSALLAANLAESGLTGIHQQATAAGSLKRATAHAMATAAAQRREPRQWPPRPTNMPTELFLSPAEDTPMIAQVLNAVTAALQREVARGSSPLVSVQANALSVTVGYRTPEGQTVDFMVVVSPVAKGPDAPGTPATTAGPAADEGSGKAEGPAAG